MQWLVAQQVALRPALEHHRHHLGNHVAGAAHDHRVADAHILAPRLGLVVQVALVTVTPPTKTGARRATGVIAPVRPTCTSMASTVVSISSAGYLCATAQRGSRVTKPSAAATPAS
jgi:hypothetical protein